jgi:transposase
MSMEAAAELVGVSVETVRRWVDAAEADGRPVAERDRDEHGRARPRSWRRPYRDAVEAWRRRRAGQTGDAGG